MADAIISNIHTNLMGTASFDMKLDGMRKAQDFIVYANESPTKNITVQSDTRIGYINVETREIIMTKSVSGGAYFHHLMFAGKSTSQLSESDAQLLKEAIYKTAGDKVGTCGVVCDNSGAFSIL